MSIQAVAWALEQDLPARPKLVLVSIANHANHVDGCCWLKAETIASEASCSRRGVFNFVGDLIRNGYVRKSVRRGDDGKQRANDYWIILDRPDAQWIKSGISDDVDQTDDGDDVDADPQDVVDGVHGVHAADSVENAPSQPVDKPTGAPGPHAHRCTHKDSAEPSESNSKASSAGARGHRSILRAYRPPPPQPIAEDTGFKSEPIFVFERTPAYDAWASVMARKTGIRTWHLTTRKFIEKDQKWRTGWYFPTLFPPAETTGPPMKETRLSDQDMRDFK